MGSWQELQELQELQEQQEQQEQQEGADEYVGGDGQQLQGGDVARHRRTHSQRLEAGQSIAKLRRQGFRDFRLANRRGGRTLPSSWFGR